jgi:hypothetical protein
MYCQSKEMSRQQDKEILTIQKELGKLKTAPSLKEAILEGLHAILDHTEYDLHEDSHPLLFDDAHSSLLKKQSSIGWEYFMKGFLAKEWGILQGQYYQYKQMNSWKYTSERWVVQLLCLLHSFRQTMWQLRNASIHGGTTALMGRVLRQRLVRDVRELYSRDRCHLSLTDRDLFKLPLQYRLKQGNQHLLLWTKQAFLIFNHYKEVKIESAQQMRITEWLQTWDDSEHSQTLLQDSMNNLNIAATPNVLSTAVPQTTHKEQLAITNWLKSWGDRSCTETVDTTTVTSTVDLSKH